MGKMGNPEARGEKLLSVSIGYAAAPAIQMDRAGGAETAGDAGNGANSENDANDVNDVNGAFQEVSGDTAVSCHLPDGSVALILSDGMGKGAQAAAESSLVVGMLRRRLKQGHQVGSAIKEINQYLLKNGIGRVKKAGMEKESFATMDLTIIHRQTGRARFYKMGAAPSYVIRSRKGDTGRGPRPVRKLEKPALPVGIIPTLKLTHVTAKLRAGDIIVMMSDGIADMAGQGNDDWIGMLLAAVPDEEGPRQLAGRILREAQARCGVRETDDATVLVAIIR